MLRSVLPCLRFAAVGAAALLLLAPVDARACSICRCGDATFNALGKDGYSAQGFRLSLDQERFDKDEGNPLEEAESQVENRYTGLLSYGFNESFSLVARLPYSSRRLTATAEGEEPEEIHTNGLSDPEIYAQLRLWAAPLSPLGRRSSLSLTAGVKTPWGQNDVREAGERVDEHAQPGTGSTDLFGSLAFLYLVDPHSAIFASTAYRHTGENDHGYRYGSTLMANLVYEHKLGGMFDGVVELNYRNAESDRVVGLDVDSTGGSLLYFTPRLLVNIGHGLVLRVGAQIPLVKNLNGFQEERAVPSIGLTYLFSHD